MSAEGGGFLGSGGEGRLKAGWGSESGGLWEFRAAPPPPAMRGAPGEGVRGQVGCCGARAWGPRGRGGVSHGPPAPIVRPGGGGGGGAERSARRWSRGLRAPAPASARPAWLCVARGRTQVAAALQSERGGHGARRPAWASQAPEPRGLPARPPQRPLLLTRVSGPLVSESIPSRLPGHGQRSDPAARGRLPPTPGSGALGGAPSKSRRGGGRR